MDSKVLYITDSYEIWPEKPIDGNRWFSSNPTPMSYGEKKLFVLSETFFFLCAFNMHEVCELNYIDFD